MTPETPPSQCLIIEDLPAARRWLALAVEQTFPGIAIDQAEDCATARQLLAQLLPDLALVDLGLPDGDGIALIAAIKNARPDCLCIVASTFADDAHCSPPCGPAPTVTSPRTRAKPS